MAVVRPIADFVVSLGTDGRIHSQGTLTKALETDKELASEVMEQAEHDKAEEAVEDIGIETTERQKKGKLVVEEEVSMGQVGWSACKCQRCSRATFTHLSTVQLFLGALGGEHPIVFWTTCLGTYVACEIVSTLQVWFLGMWTRQYDIMPPEKVPVVL